MPADLPADRLANAQFVRTLPQLRRLLANGKNSARSFSSTWRKTCNSNTDCIAGETAFFTGRITSSTSSSGVRRGTCAHLSQIAVECAVAFAHTSNRNGSRESAATAQLSDFKLVYRDVISPLPFGRVGYYATWKLRMARYGDCIGVFLAGLMEQTSLHERNQ